MSALKKFPVNAERVLEREMPPEYHGAELSQRIAQALDRMRVSGGGVMLMGAPGVGKTRQLWAVYRKRRLDQIALRKTEMEAEDADMALALFRFLLPEARVRIISEAKDIAAHRYDREWLDEIIGFTGLLCVDDIGFARSCEPWTLQTIYVIANERRAHRRSTMWTTNLDETKLCEYFTPAIASRLCGGEVINPKGEDHRPDAARSVPAA